MIVGLLIKMKIQISHLSNGVKEIIRNFLGCQLITMNNYYEYVIMVRYYAILRGEGISKMLTYLIFFIFACLSLGLFDYIVKKIDFLNTFFENIRKKTSNLDEKKQKIFKIFIFILMVLICAVDNRNEISATIKGTILGIMISIRYLSFEVI